LAIGLNRVFSIEYPDSVLGPINSLANSTIVFFGRIKPKYHTPRKPPSDYTEVFGGDVILKAKQGAD